MATSGSHT